MSDKIPKNWEECKKRGKYFYYEFKFKDGKRKKKKVRFVDKPKKLSGGSGGPQGIKIDKLFFEFKEKKEKIALLWHELYHCKFFVFNLNKENPIKIQLAKIVSWFNQENYKKKNIQNEKNFLWIEEFEADKFSALRNNVNNCLNYLRTIQSLYKKDSRLYDASTHPPIEERIKRIEKLK